MSTSDETSSSSNFEDIEDEVIEEIEEEVTVTNSSANIEQWVKFIEFCSVNSKCDQAVTKNTGIEKLCQATDADFGDQDKTKYGWILPNNNRQESLIVSFETSIFIDQIHIYESLHPGSIIKLEMLEVSRNIWWTMWQRKTSAVKSLAEHNIFIPLLRRYRLQSNTIRLTIDPTYTDQIGIQAIKLLGSKVFDANLHQKSLSTSMIELYEQAHKKIHTDIQFLIDNKIIHAHRNILCFRSQYFRSLLLNDFSEKSQIKPIELTDIKHDIFRAVLYFIYTGKYPSKISYEISMEAMVYTNKINLLSAKTAAMEHIGDHLRVNHDLVLTVYCFVKKMSPAFDILLKCIYNICAENLNEICKRKEFTELDKELMIDIICQSTERRDAKHKEQVASNTQTLGLFDETEEEEEEEEE